MLFIAVLDFIRGVFQTKALYYKVRIIYLSALIIVLLHIKRNNNIQKKYIYIKLLVR